MLKQNDPFPSEREFIAALQVGDADAWTEFVARYDQKFYRYLSYNLPTHELVEDLWNEIVLSAVSAIKDFSGEVRLTTFLYAIAYRKVADYWRRRQATALIADGNGPYAKFRVQVRDLPEQAQHALLLRYYVGLSIAEIAEVLGRSVKATESLLSRARQQLSMTQDAALLESSQAQSDDPVVTREQRSSPGSPRALLLLQRELCHASGMSEEAEIFDRACQQLAALAFIVTGEPDQRVNKLFYSRPSVDSTQA